MTDIAFTFPLANGLHARPASLLQEVCLHFAAADPSSATNATGAGPTPGASWSWWPATRCAGDPCRLEISGPDQEQSRPGLARLFWAGNCPMPTTTCRSRPAPPAGTAWLPPVFHDGTPVNCLQGRALAPGIGRGRAVRLRQRQRPGRSASPPGKRTRKRNCSFFRNACREVESELRKKAATARDPNAAGILKAHLAILADPGLPGARSAGLIGKRQYAGRPGHRPDRRHASPAPCGESQQRLPAGTGRRPGRPRRPAGRKTVRTPDAGQGAALVAARPLSWPPL